MPAAVVGYLVAQTGAATFRTIPVTSPPQTLQPTFRYISGATLPTQDQMVAAFAVAAPVVGYLVMFTSGQYVVQATTIVPTFIADLNSRYIDGATAPTQDQIDAAFAAPSPYICGYVVTLSNGAFATTPVTAKPVSLIGNVRYFAGVTPPTQAQMAALFAPTPPTFATAPLTVLSELTLAEYTAIQAAIAAEPQYSLWWQMMLAATTINCTDPRTIAGAQALVAQGILTAARVLALFGVAIPPTVAGVSPATGAAAGGTAVTVTGLGFTNATAVNFGSVAVTGVTIVSDTEITCVSPAGTAGVVDVTVTTPSGTSATVTADQYTYTP